MRLEGIAMKAVQEKNDGVQGNEKGRKRIGPKILFGVLALVLLGGGIGGILYWNSPKEITIHTQNGKVVYDFGEALRTDGLSLDVLYHNGNRTTMSEGFVCEPTELPEAGTQKIDVSYRGKSTSYFVEVIPVLTGVNIKTQPEKVRYEVGDVLVTEGIEVEARYNDASTEIISAGFTCSPMKLTRVGKEDITVSYEGKSTSFPVEVVEVADISCKAEASDNLYMEGEPVQKNRIVLNVKYSDGSQENISEGFTCSPQELSETGEQEVTISYKGKTTTFPVTVIPQVTFEKLEVVCAPFSNPSTGEGYNSQGESVNRVLWIEFILPEETRINFPPTITCSWDHVVNGEGVWEREVNFEDAKNGVTYCEIGTMDTKDGKKFIYTLALPDNSEIEGEQSFTMHVGNSQKTVSFSLVYEGDYENGSGWSIKNVRL